MERDEQTKLSDPVSAYEAAMEALAAGSKDIQSHQHQAVLALARAGAVDFALKEFVRFGLDKIGGHEDIMALGARLEKDLYLRSGGSEAQHHARKSAQLYESGFQATQGYYSGINAATMSMLAKSPDDAVMDQAKKVLDLLPPPEKLRPEDHYFIEATRAEALLLLGKPAMAKESLAKAVRFDPQNFTAHASTLKQFRMISEFRGQDAEWLSKFNPPRCAHYAGHIFSLPGAPATSHVTLTDAQAEALKIDISDFVQKEEIGFAYGALAAGSDILMAETLLEEGAELNVILPVPVDLFIQKSVIPYGEQWLSRFKACLDASTPPKILTASDQWPEPELNRFAGQVAMGQAILRSAIIATEAVELLLWDGLEKATYTSAHATDWARSGNRHIIVPFKNNRTKKPGLSPSMERYKILIKSSNTDAVRSFDSLVEAARAALELRDKTDNAQIAMAVSIPAKERPPELDVLADQALPDTVLVTESVACLLAWAGGGQFELCYAGQIGSPSGSPIRAYSLSY